MHTNKRQSRTGERCVRFLFACILVTPILLSGCGHLHEGLAGSAFQEANDLFSQGSYTASLGKYEQILRKHPSAADRVLFQMGMVLAYPNNEQRDYEKARECFQKVLKDYPGSRYRQDSAEMISHIDNVTIRDKRVLAQQKQIATLERELKNKEDEAFTLKDVIATLKGRIEALERDLATAVAILKAPVSRVLIEKGERRLTLISKDKALKSYRIALGGNPNGPKERIGDNRTPEGSYVIDSRNRDSRYHLSLHISYPNEKDRRRAKELGVSPGGNIMIHGLKNGFSWVGDVHTELDWTQGCIAVTNDEIEEIARLVPDGTVVEIRP